MECAWSKALKTTQNLEAVVTSTRFGIPAGRTNHLDFGQKINKGELCGWVHIDL
jgi:hypothetical protein